VHARPRYTARRQQFQALNATKLAKLLGMVGSSADGEALNAARLADRMVRQAGATWFDLLSEDHESSVDDLIAFCLDHEDRLNFWEHGFLLGIRGRQYLTSKQLAKIDQIVAKLKAGRAAA